MRRVAPHHPIKARNHSSRPAESLRIGASHAGHPHAGPCVRLVRGGNRLHLCLRATFDFDPFSLLQPASTPHPVRDRLPSETPLRRNTLIFCYFLARLVSPGLP